MSWTLSRNNDGRSLLQSKQSLTKPRRAIGSCRQWPRSLGTSLCRSRIRLCEHFGADRF
jgi:hypothetical protein